MSHRVRTHTKQSVPCLSVFDPQSPVCLTSVSASYRGQAWHTLSPWQDWNRWALACYRCTNTERHHHFDCLWRIHLEFKTGNSIQSADEEKICDSLSDCWYQRTTEQCHYKMGKKGPVGLEQCECEGEGRGDNRDSARYGATEPECTLRLIILSVSTCSCQVSLFNVKIPAFD